MQDADEVLSCIFLWSVNSGWFIPFVFMKKTLKNAIKKSPTPRKREMSDLISFNSNYWYETEELYFALP